MNNKKFIVGLSRLEDFGTLDHLDLICQKYNQYINTWYISPPFGKEYASRLSMLIEPTEENLLEIKQQISIIKKNNQKIQLALNGLGLKNLSSKQILKEYNYWIDLFGQPDSIVLLDELIPYFKDYNIPLTYSYNNYYIKTKFKNLQFCNTIVLGNKDIRNISFMQNLKDKYNIKIELLLNNGCHFLCQRKCGFICTEQQQQIINKIGKNYALAEQSLLPYELNYYPNNLIDYYKISSRPIFAKELDFILFSYINKLTMEEIKKFANLSTIKGWQLFSRLTELSKNFEENEEVNINQILEIKQQIWDKTIGQKY